MVSIIIPVLHFSRPRNLQFFYKKKYTILDVLQDIKKKVSIEHETIIVCNTGFDEKVIKLLQGHEAVNKFCINSTNVGVSRGWNIGACMAEGNMLCFLNDDMELMEGDMEKLCDVLTAEDFIGEVGPKGEKWYITETGERVKERVGLEIPEEADAIAGHFFLIKKSVFDMVGGFNTAYTPAGYEEIDMSFRIRAKGFKCLAVPNIKAKHHGVHGVSSYRHKIEYLNKSIYTDELAERNKKIFISEWYPQFFDSIYGGKS